MTQKKLLILSQLASTNIKAIRHDAEGFCESSNLTVEFRSPNDVEELIRWVADEGDAYDALIIDVSDTIDADATARDRLRIALQPAVEREQLTFEVSPKNTFASDDPPMPIGTTGFVFGLGLKCYVLSIQSIASRLARAS